MHLQFHCLAHALAQETIRNVFFRKKHFHTFPLATFTSLYSQSRVSRWIRVQMSWVPLYNGLRCSCTSHEAQRHSARCSAAQFSNVARQEAAPGRPGATTGKRLSEFLLAKSGASDLDGLNRNEAKLGKRCNMLEPLDQTRQVEVKLASLRPLTALSLGRWPELPSIFVANASCR